MGALNAALKLGEMLWLSLVGAFNVWGLPGDAETSSSVPSGVVRYFLNSVFVLGLVFIVLAVVCLYRFGLMLYYKHNPKSLETSFYLCVAFWGILRAVFFFVAPIFPESKTLFFIYGLPTNVEVAVYSQLLLYCGQRVHFAKWRAIRWRVYWAFIVLNIILFLINIVATSIVMIKDFTSNTPAVVNSSIFLATFLLIAVGFTAYSIALARQKERSPLFKHESQKALIALTVTITVCMAIHCGWDAFNLIKHHHVKIPSRDVTDQITIFLMFLFWELIPACVVIVFFGRIPTGDELVQRQPDGTVTVTVDDGRNERGSGSRSRLLEAEEKQSLLPQKPVGRTVDASSPGSFAGSVRHGVVGVNVRGSVQLIDNDGSTPKFNYVTQQLAAFAENNGRNDTAPSHYRPPSRSSLEFNRRIESDEED